MFKTENALKAAEVLSNQISSVKTELKEIQDQCELFQVDCGKTEDLEREAIELAVETEVLKKSAPEGNEDATIQYFLAIAELEKTNAMLRQQEKLTQDNLESLDQNIDGTRKLIGELSEMRAAFALKAKEATSDENNDPNQAADTEKSKIQQIDSDIRLTRKLYKEFKTFLGDYLALIDPVDEMNGGHFGNLLQELWTAYQSKETEDNYIKISHLVWATIIHPLCFKCALKPYLFQTFDVEHDHLHLLVNNQIAELHDTDKDLIRLVDFTS